MNNANQKGYGVICYRLLCRIVQCFPDLFVRNAEKFIACLSAICVSVAGAAFEWSSMADAEI